MMDVSLPEDAISNAIKYQLFETTDIFLMIIN